MSSYAPSRCAHLLLWASFHMGLLFMDPSSDFRLSHVVNCSWYRVRVRMCVCLCVCARAHVPLSLSVCVCVCGNGHVHGCVCALVEISNTFTQSKEINYTHGILDSKGDNHTQKVYIIWLYFWCTHELLTTNIMLCVH